MTRQRHDTVHGRHADHGGVDLRIELELGEDEVFQFIKRDDGGAAAGPPRGHRSPRAMLRSHSGRVRRNRRAPHASRVTRDLSGVAGTGVSSSRDRGRRM